MSIWIYCVRIYVEHCGGIAREAGRFMRLLHSIVVGRLRHRIASHRIAT